MEGRPGHVMSRLAAATVRSLVSAQVTVILTGAGKRRWCELAMADQTAAERFLQVVPHAVFVCVHRGCPDVIREGVAASRPWGLYGQRLAPYLLSYPGNSVAAMAAYWATCTEELLSFEDANLQVTRRIRYEDTIGEPAEALTALRAWLRLDRGPGELPPGGSDPGEPEDGTPGSNEPELPVEMIPPPLRQRISRLHVKLGYPPVSA